MNKLNLFEFRSDQATACFSAPAMTPALLIAALAFSGCDSLQTREDVERASAPVASKPSAASSAAADRARARAMERDAEAIPSGATSGSPTGAQQGPPSPSTPPNGGFAPLPAAPTNAIGPQSSAFLQREAPRVGLILGAGGMKAFAHVGVLKEFARARIPIASVVGLEWGAVMAGIYALQGQANEVEWKSFRLKDSELPERSFLSSSIKPQPIAMLHDFLDMAFARESLEHDKIEFGCPSYNAKSEKLLWLNRGSARDAIARCLAYPPFYLDAGGWTASPFAIEEAATYLRAHGANFVIFVNPLAQGELLPEKLQSEAYVDATLWSEIRRHANRPQIPGVNMTISINGSGASITDYEARRQLMDAGSKAAADAINKLTTKYGF